MTDTTEESTEVERVSFSNKDVLMALFLKFGVFKCEIDFDGSGDSGQLGDIRFEGISDEALATPVQTVIDCVRRDWSNKGWVEKIETRPITGNLKEIVEEFANEILEVSGYDWYNNDGGWGTITVVPGDKSISVDMNVRITDSENHMIEM